MSQERVMLLIDADNLSVDVMEQAVRLLLNQHGGLHVRRAYCTAESAVANQAAFKRLGIKPMVNLATGKNSTDIAMAVDALDLVLAERPEVVVIASSDSDFAPLVQRLREKGCVVRGIGQKGKVGDETQDVYDDYTVIEHRGGGSARAPARSAAKSASPGRGSRARVARPERTAAPLPDNQADASAIFEAIVEGALEDDAADPVQPVPPPVSPPAPQPKPAAKTRSRARKPAASAALAGADAVDGALTAAEAPASPAAVTLVAPAAVSAAAAADDHADADVAPAPKPRATRGRKPKVAAEAAQAATAPEQTPPARKAAASAASAASAPSVPLPAAPRRPAAEPDEPAGAASARGTLAAVMACLPELARGQALALNVAVQRLREARLLGKNSSSLKLFSQLSESLELLPARNPSQVRLRR